MLDFKVMDISFCGRTTDNVIKAESKKQVLDILEQRYGITIKDKQALILTDRNIKYLQLNQHLITLKTGGSNYFLFMTRINDVQCCFFIDRKVKEGYTIPRIISVKYRFDDSVFNDTLLDGELVKDKENNWMFLISNVLVFKGEKQKGNVITRYNKIYSLLKNCYTPDNLLDICPLVVKKIFTYEDYDKLITQFIPSLTYQIRGLYFNTLNTKHANYLFLYKQNQNFKPYNKGKTSYNNNNKFNKSGNKHGSEKSSNYDNSKKELDSNNKIFKISKTMQPEIYDLHEDNNKIGVAYISGIKCSRLIKKILKEKDSANVECTYNTKFSKWEPIKEH